MAIANNDWKVMLIKEFNKPYCKKIAATLNDEYKNHKIHPDYENIFAAFRFTPYEKTKVVILGQDPYHGENQANGLSFSVNSGVALPPSLKNIFKEISMEYDVPPMTDGDLTFWAKQGVLLLNSTLTVREGQANSHYNIGWSKFTNNVISILNSKSTPVVFLLWGNFASTKSILISNPIHTVLQAAHPSPLSAYKGFFGCNHFKKANEILEQNGYTPINWVKND